MENKRIRALVLEDSRADLRLFEEFLGEASGRDCAFEITGADRLGRALELLAASAYDIILCDLFLPDSSGLDTLTAICGRAPDTPIVVLTAFEDKSVAVAAVHLGAQDYLVKKQINGEALVRVIRYSIERKQLERLKDSFASLVSHELRSPLTTVIAALTMVLDTPCPGLGEVEKKLLNVAYEDAQRINRIITKLLDISRMGAGRSALKKTEADIVRLAEEAVARFAPRAQSRRIELVGKYSADRISALLDMDGIAEVFTNLVSNALKFTEQGRIEIAVTDRGDAVECSVSDTGIGISKKDQAALFSKFRQFGKPVLEEEKGNGLGLFLAKEIVRRHGGTLTVASEPGKGSIFSFTLPRRAEDPVNT